MGVKDRLTGFVKRNRSDDNAYGFINEQDFKSLFPKQTMEAEDDRLKTFSSNSCVFDISTHALAKAGFCCSGSDGSVVCFKCFVVFPDWKKCDVPIQRHCKVVPKCNFARDLKKKCKPKRKIAFDSPIKPSNHDEESDDEYDEDQLSFLKSEFNRLVSFENWPLSSPVDPYDMAATGFFCTEGSKVSCVGCFVEVSEWKLGDQPKLKHKEISPDCSFVNGEEDADTSLEESEKLQAVRMVVEKENKAMNKKQVNKQ